MDDDNFALKQRPFVQQDLIAGLTVAKGVWAYEARDMTRLVPVEIEVTDDFGERPRLVHLHRGGGAPDRRPRRPLDGGAGRARLLLA